MEKPGRATYRLLVFAEVERDVVGKRAAKAGDEIVFWQGVVTAIVARGDVAEEIGVIQAADDVERGDRAVARGESVETICDGDERGPLRGADAGPSQLDPAAGRIRIVGHINGNPGLGVGDV